MEPRHVVALRIGGGDLRHDRVEVEGRGVDDARPRRTPGQDLRCHQRTGIEADGAGGDQVAPAHGDEVWRTGAGADEMNGHGRPLTASDRMLWRAQSLIPKPVDPFRMADSGSAQAARTRFLPSILAA